MSNKKKLEKSGMTVPYGNVEYAESGSYQKERLKIGKTKYGPKPGMIDITKLYKLIKKLESNEKTNREIDNRASNENPASDNTGIWD